MNTLGFKDLNIGLEPEFYLFKNTEKLIFSDQGSYFDMAPLDASENCRHDIVLELEKLGFNVEASHHEVGPDKMKLIFVLQVQLKHVIMCRLLNMLLSRLRKDMVYMLRLCRNQLLELLVMECIQIVH